MTPSFAGPTSRQVFDCMSAYFDSKCYLCPFSFEVGFHLQHHTTQKETWRPLCPPFWCTGKLPHSLKKHTNTTNTWAPVWLKVGTWAVGRLSDPCLQRAHGPGLRQHAGGAHGLGAYADRPLPRLGSEGRGREHGILCVCVCVCVLFFFFWGGFVLCVCVFF